MTSRHLLPTATGIALAVVSLAAGGGSARVDAAPSQSERERELVELGRRLFMDPTVSRLGTNSCASCHDPERAFGDARARSPDDGGPTARHSQTLVDLTGEGFHWDGEFKSVRQLLVARVAPADEANAQAQANFDSRLAAARSRGLVPDARGPSPVPGTERPPVPQGYGGVPATPGDAPVTPVASRLAEDGRYAESFRAAFGSPTPTTARILDAMDAYCGSIRSTTNAFDRFLAGDDGALSASAQRGLALFEGRANCAACHTTRPADGGRALFTDGRWHDTGVAYRHDERWSAGLVGGPAKDRGRSGVTLADADEAGFKTPTLRDVAIRAPYMHDGSFDTLAEVVLYYAGGGTPNPYLDPAIRKIALEKGDVDDLVAFLESLSGTERAGLGLPGGRAAPLTVTVEDLSGAPMPFLSLDVHPYGDRLKGDDTWEYAPRVMTGDDGKVTLTRPLTTHTALTTTGFQLGNSRPVPDSCRTQRLIATPTDVISLRIRRTPGSPSLPASISVVPSERGVSMGNCGDRAVATLTRIRMLAPDEALYAGKGVARGARVRATLVFDGGERQLVTEVPLGGGACEPLRLVRETAAERTAPGSGPPSPPVNHDPGEGADHGSDRDIGPRDTGDRR